MNNAIANAEFATQKVDGHIRRAVAAVDAWQENGYGIFSDPLQITLNISRALAELEAAQKMMSETRWPADGDYEAQESEAHQ